MNALSKNTIAILVFLTLIIIAIVGYLFWFNYNTQRGESIISKNEQTVRNKCLGENEAAEYEIKKKETKEGGVVIIRIKNKLNREPLYSFEIKNVRINYRPVEMHNCNLYITRMFNYDSAKEGAQVIGYKEELWKYQYDNSGGMFILLAEKPKEFISYYSPDFRIDPAEKYLVLERGYFGKDDYSLVIKNLQTKEDAFTLSAKEIAKQHPNVIGSFNMHEWTKDSRYFWGDIFDGAYVNGYFRIDTQNWKADIFEAPDGAMGGSPLNINTGYLPIQPGQVWTGDYQMTQELKEQYKKEGRKSSLYLYNLFTKGKILITSTVDDPLWWFKPQWLSDTELEYEMPSGEKKIYKINEK